jgi:predicted phosphohydrolase
MKIQYCSDLHIEFSQNSDYLMKNKIPPFGDILVLAGDITYLGDIFFKHAFFDYISNNFKTTYWIPGNHEFYGGFDLSYFEGPVQMKIRHNIFLVNNISAVYGDIELFFTTLWTKLDKNRIPYVLNGVNDFFKIKYKGKVIQIKEFEHHHNLSVSFLEQALDDSQAMKKIVVTHHVPSQICNAEEFRDSWINSAFVVDMDDFIINRDIDYWIYGHHHRNISEKQISGTKFVTNQLGYIQFGENKDFNMEAIIEI